MTEEDLSRALSGLGTPGYVGIGIVEKAGGRPKVTSWLIPVVSKDLELPTYRADWRRP